LFHLQPVAQANLMEKGPGHHSSSAIPGNGAGNVKC
jgi:hypothetical protein